MILNKINFILFLCKQIKFNRRSNLERFIFNDFFFLNVFYFLDLNNKFSKIVNYSSNNSILTLSKSDFLEKKKINIFLLFNFFESLNVSFKNNFYSYSNYSIKNINIYFNLFFNSYSNDNYFKLQQNQNKFLASLSNFFLRKFIEQFSNKKCYIVFNSYDIVFLEINSMYISLYKRLKKIQMFNRSGNFLKELLEIVILVLYSKDLRLLNNWIVKVSERMHFKLHKKFFYLIKMVFYKYFFLYFKYFGCLGFFLKVKGKIGLGGNSKKRNIIKIGKFSLTSKKLKIKFEQGQIRSYSGTLGIEFLLSYV